MPVVASDRRLFLPGTQGFAWPFYSDLANCPSKLPTMDCRMVVTVLPREGVTAEVSSAFGLRLQFQVLDQPTTAICKLPTTAGLE